MPRFKLKPAKIKLYFIQVTGLRKQLVTEKQYRSIFRRMSLRGPIRPFGCLAIKGKVIVQDAVLAQYRRVKDDIGCDDIPVVCKSAVTCGEGRIVGWNYNCGKIGESEANSYGYTPEPKT